jgi:hypothetical protein
LREFNCFTLFGFDNEQLFPQGLKPALILSTLRGAEAPLFHGATGIHGFFRNL